MQTIIITTVLLISVVFFLLIARSKKKAHLKELRSSLPKTFNGARCVMNEQNISTHHPVSLHGRIDQLFKLENGHHIIMDTKNRAYNKVFFSDQVQLSVYATILASKGYVVHPIAYLRITGTKHPIYAPVKLLNPEQIIKMSQHYWLIKEGRITPVCTCGKH